MQLVLIRHAQSTGNVKQVMPGTVDYALTPQGWAQADQLAQHLQQTLAAPTRIYSSPLQRSLHTAQRLRQAWPTADAREEVHIDARLKEIENGIFADLTWPEAQAQFPDLCHRLETTPHWIPIPQAESPLQCRQRAEAFFQDLIETTTAQDRVWVVSHGGLIPYLLSVALGSDRSWGFHCPLAAYLTLVGDWHQGSGNLQDWEYTSEPQPLNLQGDPLQERHNVTRWQLCRFPDSVSNVPSSP